MTIVVDASIVMSWYFDDEKSAATDLVLDLVAADGAIVPIHWKLEIANGFRSAIRRKRIDRVYRDNVLQQLFALPIEFDLESGLRAWDTTLALADKHDLTPYDAAYLELAMRLGHVLATLDKELTSAAEREAIETWPREN